MSARKKQLRASFREAVFSRDNYKCKFCDCTEKLDAHHIMDRSKMPNGGYVKENGITVCPRHHLTCELYHITDGKEFHEGFHPADLYKLIGSYYELAVVLSKRL